MIKRDLYLQQLVAGKGNGLIKIITGIRRCGKSFLLFNLFYKHLIESGVPSDHIIKIAFSDCTSLQSIEIVTQEKEPDLSLERIEYLLQALSEYSKVISLRVPIGCGYAYRHHPAFEGKFQKIISAIDV